MPDPAALPEATRNRLLRRVDWRFLLPSPEPARTVCFADGALAEALTLVSGEVRAPSDDRRADCDLAVTVRPSRATLRRCRAALRPGGSLYAEWPWPVLGGARAVRRRLAAAGFADVRCYWAWPHPARSSPQLWLPLDAPWAMRQVLAVRPLAQGRLVGAGQRALRATGELAVRLGIVAPLCAVARRPEPNVDGAGRPRAPVDQAAFVLLTGGRRSVNKVVGLQVQRDAPSPLAVVKLPRVPESVPPLRREACALRSLESRPVPVSGVPRVLAFEERGASTRLVEMALTGVPLFTRLRPDTYRPLALQAADWLAGLAAGSAPVAKASWWPRLVEPALADFCASFGPVLDSERVERTRHVLSRLTDLPLVCEQRDFSPWNVMVDARGELIVLDWESCESRGLPALDLIYFLTYLAFFVDGAMATGRTRASYRASLDPATFAGRVTRDSLTRYCEKVGLSPALLPPLRVLTWLIHARSEIQQLRADAGGPPPVEALRRALFFDLWDESLRAAEPWRAERGDRAGPEVQWSS